MFAHCHTTFEDALALTLSTSFYQAHNNGYIMIQVKVHFMMSNDIKSWQMTDRELANGIQNYIISVLHMFLSIGSTVCHTLLTLINIYI